MLDCYYLLFCLLPTEKQVNISSSLRQSLVEQAEVTGIMFDRPLTEVIHILESDKFHRFQQSPEFATLLKA